MTHSYLDDSNEGISQLRVLRIFRRRNSGNRMTILWMIQWAIALNEHRIVGSRRQRMRVYPLGHPMPIKAIESKPGQGEKHTSIHWRATLHPRSFVAIFTHIPHTFNDTAIEQFTRHQHTHMQRSISKAALLFLIWSICTSGADAASSE